MASRVGIEITQSRCTLVEVEGGRRGTGRVRAFRSIACNPADSAGLVAVLSQLRASRIFSERARVVVWGLRSGHQLMSLPPASRDDLQDLAAREARKSMPFLAEGEVTSGIAVNPGGRHDMKRDVVFAAASVADIRARLQPLASAGFQVDAVVTPPLALAALARLRSGRIQAPEAYLSVNRDASCLAIVRDGLLVFSRELPMAEGQDRAAFTARLASELKRSLLLYKQNSRLAVSRVLVCGDYRELRSLTAPLMDASEADVETLDTTDGLGSSAAASADSSAGELRVAWAVAADDRAQVNLLPVQARERQDSRQFRERLLRMAALVLILLAILYAGARVWAHSAQANAAALRDRVAVLEQARNDIDRARAFRSDVQLRRHALDAFAEQGPRIAQILASLADAAPKSRQVVMTTVDFEPAGGAWRLTLSGQATGRNPAVAQASFNQFLRQLASSPYVGPQVGSPVLRVYTETADERAEANLQVQHSGQPPASAETGSAANARAAGSGTPSGSARSSDVRSADKPTDLIASRRLWDSVDSSRAAVYAPPTTRNSLPAAGYPLSAATRYALPATTQAIPVKGVPAHRIEFTVVFEVPK